jgi:glycerol kinase
MAADAKASIGDLKVDGGATANDFLCQFQADVLEAIVERPAVIETTALGAAYLAGLGSGLWRSLDAVAARRAVDRRFRPSMDAAARAEGYAGWRRAVERARHAGVNVNPQGGHR